MDVTSDQYPNLFWRATTSILSRDHLQTDNQQFTNRKYHLFVHHNKNYLSTLLLGIPTRGGCKRTWNWLFHFFWHRFWPQITTFSMTTFTRNIAKLCTQNSLELFYPNPPYELPSQLGKQKMVEQHLSDAPRSKNRWFPTPTPAPLWWTRDHLRSKENVKKCRIIDIVMFQNE